MEGYKSSLFWKYPLLPLQFDTSSNFEKSNEQTE